MDSLITFIVLLIASAVGTWLKKRAQQNSESEMTHNGPDRVPPVNRTGQPPTAIPHPKPRPVRWEEELRRLLEGESPLGLPPMRPPLVQVPEPQQTTPSVPAPPPAAPIPTYDPMSSLPVPEFTKITNRELAPMQESSQAYEKAAQLDEFATERIQKAAPEAAVPATVTTHQRASHEAGEVVALFKNARTARQAIIASIILQPPKSLAEN